MSLNFMVKGCQEFAESLYRQFFSSVNFLRMEGRFYMRIGYACKVIGIPNTGMRSCLMKNASESTLTDLIVHNLNALDVMIDYNRSVGIQLFRISSDLVPFGSSVVNQLRWWEQFAARFSAIGEKISSAGIRVSMHPGQYTVLNSPNEDVVNHAVQDLQYHEKVLSSLNVGAENKIILHVGGVYGDKARALSRFEENYRCLDEPIRQRLVIENDDRNYTAEDVLQLGIKLHIPVVYDNLHNAVNPGGCEKSDADWIKLYGKTWGKADGPQKIHYAQQDPAKRPGAHSNSIRINEFMNFASRLDNRNIDIMLEVKDKNVSALKCSKCLHHLSCN